MIYFFRNSEIQIIINLSNLFFINLNSKPLCHIIPNALVISKKITQFFILRLKASKFFWDKMKILSFVCLWALNPDCCLTIILFFLRCSLILIKIALQSLQSTIYNLKTLQSFILLNKLLEHRNKSRISEYSA
jgi:hypothetical protein